MDIDEIIFEVRTLLIELTYFSFHVEKKSDDGGQTIDIYIVDDDVRTVQSNLSGKYGKARLIFYAMDEEDILYLHNKNM
jgi:hypothetical protein